MTAIQTTDEHPTAALECERLRLCDALDDLDPAEWASPSACAGWTVRDVVAHVCLGPRDTALTFVLGMIRHAGSFDRMTAQHARRHAARTTPAQLVVQLRESAASVSTSVGGSPADSLVDVIVHGQDIVRPLGRTITPGPEHVVASLDHVLASRWYGAKKRFADNRLAATDATWSWGTGRHEIAAPALDLLLLATGRSIDVDGARPMRR